MTFNIPLYYEVEYKTKSNKTILINNNWYRNAHYQIANKVKHYYKELVLDQIEDPKEMNEVRIECELYYKSVVSDLDNYSILLKFVLDPLQEIGVLVNDNVKYVKEINWKVIKQDKLDPRLIVKIIRLD